MALMPHWPIYTGEVKSIDNRKVHKALALLGNPQDLLKNVIHVTGTNGKGSTTAYLKYILKENGYSVNTYTSPHLIRCNERININGSEISDDELFYQTEKVKNICEEHGIEVTIFEVTTIVAILAFSDRQKKIFERQSEKICEGQNEVYGNKQGLILTKQFSLACGSNLTNKLDVNDFTSENHNKQSLTNLEDTGSSNFEQNIQNIDPNYDFNIIEVGMGGLNDATNVFTSKNVILTIITPISYDHVKFIGPSLKDIAKHKTAIQKSFIPSVIGPQCNEVLNEIILYGQKHNIPLTIYGKHFEVFKHEADESPKTSETLKPEGQFKTSEKFGFDELLQCENNIKAESETFILSYNGQDGLFCVPPNLPGDHQIQNLSTAIVSLTKLNGLSLSYDKICKGIQKTKWPARLEKITNSKVLSMLPKGSQVYFDGAHNEGGAIALSQFIKCNLIGNSVDLFSDSQSLGSALQNAFTQDKAIQSLNHGKTSVERIFLLLARSKETDSAVFARHFNSVVGTIIAFRSNGEVKPEHESVIQAQVQTVFKNCITANSLRSALELVCAQCDERPVKIVICGSLYIARELDWIYKNK